MAIKEKRKRRGFSARMTGSAEFAGVRVGYLLERDGMPESDAGDETVDALFKLSGPGWDADEYNGGGICNTSFTVKFTHVPTKEEVEAVRLQIVAVLNSQNMKGENRP